MVKPFVVSQSQLKCWRRCRRQYHYRYVLGLQRKKRPAPLLRGTVIHDMIEKFIRGQDHWSPFHDMVKTYGKLFNEEKEMYGDMPQEIEVLMEGYFRWYKKDPIKYRKSLLEKRLFVPLTPSILLSFKPDGVGTTKDGRLWLVDHKSHKQIPDDQVKYADIQSALYVWGLDQLGLIKCDGVLWNYIRMKAPTVPELLKNGELSRRKNIDTTWEVYRQAIKAHGLKEADYEDMKELLKGSEENFYVRSYLPVSKPLINELVNEAQTTAREIKRKAGKDKTRNIEKHCKWCEHFPLCYAELRGLDTEFMKKTDFEVKKDVEEKDEKIREAA